MKLKPILKMDKKGVLGLETVKETIVYLLILVVTVIAVFLGLNALLNAGVFPAGSANLNNTNLIVSNITYGATTFFSIVPTIFTVLGVVVLLLVIGLILYAVYRFSSRSDGSSM
jgi:hypothetical protein